MIEPMSIIMQEENLVDLKERTFFMINQDVARLLFLVISLDL